MRIIKKLFTLMTTLAVMSVTLTGCGGVNKATDAKDNKTTTENVTTNNDNMNENTVGEDLGNAVEDVGDAVGDVAEGAVDAVDDLLDADGLNDYNEAHEYFLRKMGANNNKAKYELRNEKKELATFNDTNKGYTFELYDTANTAEGERIGKFYVEPKTGKIYHENEETNKIEEYTMTGTQGTNAANTNNTGATDANGTDGATGTNAGTTR